MVARASRPCMDGRDTARLSTFRNGVSRPTPAPLTPAPQRPPPHTENTRRDERGGPPAEPVGDPRPFPAEEGAAAGGDHAGIEPKEKKGLHRRLGQDKGDDREEEQVLLPDERVIVSPVVRRVEDEPHPRKEEVDAFQQERRIAETVDVQHPGGAHGAGKEGMEEVCREEEKEEGQELNPQGEGK